MVCLFEVEQTYRTNMKKNDASPLEKQRKAVCLRVCVCVFVSLVLPMVVGQNVLALQRDGGYFWCLSKSPLFLEWVCEPTGKNQL